MSNFRSHARSGFTLIETLVVIGILGVSSLAMMSLLEWSSRGTRTVRAKNEVNTLQQELQQTYSKKTVCSTLLAGHRLDGDRLVAQVASRRDALPLSSSRNWTAGQPIPGTPLRLESFHFEDFSPLTGTERQFLGRLRITVRETEGGSSVPSEVRIPIVVQTLPGGEIAECAGEDSSPRRIITCQAERHVSWWGPGGKARVYEFSAADCGGELPDSNYEGFLSSYGMWGGVATVRVLNPGEQIPFGDRTYLQGSERRTTGQITGPAITAFPSEEQQAGRYFFKVQYVQRSILGTSAGATAPRFVTSCNPGSRGFMYQWCCRIDTVTGETQCKESNGYSASTTNNNNWRIASTRSPATAPMWLVFPAPFNAASSHGSYTLSCTDGGDTGQSTYFAGPTCCRTNAVSGETECKQASNNPHRGGAYGAGNPNTHTNGTTFVLSISNCQTCNNEAFAWNSVPNPF